jgi:crotonobetainyl-CoA:carnitine CoA-transferase CaiB-like acyl-CoA transferase
MLEIAFADGVCARMPRIPVEVGAHDFGLRRQAPAVGEHTAEILAALGVTNAEIERLRARGIVALGPAAPRPREPR